MRDGCEPAARQLFRHKVLAHGDEPSTCSARSGPSRLRSGRASSLFGSAPDARSLSHALATYVRTLFSGASDYDRYEAGETTCHSGRKARRAPFSSAVRDKRRSSRSR